MKNFRKRIFWVVILTTVISYTINGQTNVSGGIYANTTWTLANSPYIVTDTVVVFPGVTLTIQPGVTVKFDDNVRLEIRQAYFIAEGTSNDSIIFTSNSSLPMPGIWSSICLNEAKRCKFKYCNIKYASDAIYEFNPTDSITIKYCNINYNGEGICVNSLQSPTFINNSNLNHNSIGISMQGCSYCGSYVFIDNCNINYNSNGISKSATNRTHINNCNFINNSAYGFSGIYWIIINNCTFSNNQTGAQCTEFSNITNSIFNSNSIEGLSISTGFSDTIINNEFTYNGIGLHDYSGNPPNFITKNIIDNNNIGIKLEDWQDSIFCNKICNNNTYDLFYNVAFGSNTAYIANNYWCSSDSATIASYIYDGYDNINLGLVNFMPLDIEECYLTTEIPINESRNFSLNIFPNPASDYLIIELTKDFSEAEIKIFNLLGELEYSSTMTGQKTDIDISSLTRGMYIIQIAEGDNTNRQKIIKQ